MTSFFVALGTVLRVFSFYITIVFDFVCWNSDFTSVFINDYAFWSVVTLLPLVVSALRDSDGLLFVVTLWRIRDFQSISISCWSDRG